MEVYKSLADLPKGLKFGLTIGNFDGVHLGHQGLLKALKEKCKSKGLDLVVMTFVPHPMVILRNERSFLLNSYKERIELLGNLGISHVVEIPFTRDFSTLTPSEFIDKHILVNSGISYLFLGYDFAFGANKKGDHAFVLEYCKNKNIEIEIQKKVEDDLGTFSSSLARKALLDGRPLDCKKVLGRPFFIKGRVIKGAGRGRQIGFPTANIELEFERIVPQKGVYATVCSFRGCDYLSITNIGNNPTFKDDNSLNVETNIFDFDHDIYGEEIKVSFFEKIRDEKKFSSVNELIAQISKDVEFRRTLNV